MYGLALLVLLVGAASAVPQTPYKANIKASSPYKPAVTYPYPSYPYPAPAYPYPTPSYYPYANSAYPYPVQVPTYARPPVYATPVSKPFVAPVIKPIPAGPQYIQPVAILKQTQEDNFDGSFSYGFESENGIASQASGFLKNAGTPDEAQVIQGQYSYTASDGTPIVTSYYADETGFHAEGDHLPVAPPIPEAIAKSLAYQASLPENAKEQ